MILKKWYEENALKSFDFPIISENLIKWFSRKNSEKSWIFEKNFLEKFKQSELWRLGEEGRKWMEKRRKGGLHEWAEATGQASVFLHMMWRPPPLHAGYISRPSFFPFLNPITVFFSSFAF